MTTVYITRNGAVKQAIAEQFKDVNGVSLKKHENNAPYLTNTATKISISHKDRYLVVAFSDGEIGVDIERPCDNEGVIKIARRYFGDKENESVNTIADFYRAWTKKESYAKLTTQGISPSVLLTDTSAESIEYQGVTYHYNYLTDLDNYVITVLSEDAEVSVRKLLN